MLILIIALGLKIQAQIISRTAVGPLYISMAFTLPQSYPQGQIQLTWPYQIENPSYSLYFEDGRLIQTGYFQAQQNQTYSFSFISILNGPYILNIYDYGCRQTFNSVTRQYNKHIQIKVKQGQQLLWSDDYFDQLQLKNINNRRWNSNMNFMLGAQRAQFIWSQTSFINGFYNSLVDIQLIVQFEDWDFMRRRIDVHNDFTIIIGLKNRCLNIDPGIQLLSAQIQNSSTCTVKNQNIIMCQIPSLDRSNNIQIRLNISHLPLNKKIDLNIQIYSKQIRNLFTFPLNQSLMMESQLLSDQTFSSSLNQIENDWKFTTKIFGMFNEEQVRIDDPHEENIQLNFVTPYFQKHTCLDPYVCYFLVKITSFYQIDLKDHQLSHNFLGFTNIQVDCSQTNLRTIVCSHVSLIDPQVQYWFNISSKSSAKMFQTSQTEIILIKQDVKQALLSKKFSAKPVQKVLRKTVLWVFKGQIWTLDQFYKYYFFTSEYNRTANLQYQGLQSIVGLNVFSKSDFPSSIIDLVNKQNYALATKLKVRLSNVNVNSSFNECLLSIISEPPDLLNKCKSKGFCQQNYSKTLQIITNEGKYQQIQLTIDQRIITDQYIEYQYLCIPYSKKANLDCANIFTDQTHFSIFDQFNFTKDYFEITANLEYAALSYKNQDDLNFGPYFKSIGQSYYRMPVSNYSMDSGDTFSLWNLTSLIQPKKYIGDSVTYLDIYFDPYLLSNITGNFSLQFDFDLMDVNSDADSYQYFGEEQNVIFSLSYTDKIYSNVLVKQVSLGTDLINRKTISVQAQNTIFQFTIRFFVNNIEKFRLYYPADKSIMISKDVVDVSWFFNIGLQKYQIYSPQTSSILFPSENNIINDGYISVSLTEQTPLLASYSDRKPTCFNSHMTNSTMYCPLQGFYNYDFQQLVILYDATMGIPYISSNPRGLKEINLGLKQTPTIQFNLTASVQVSQFIISQTSLKANYYLPQKFNLSCTSNLNLSLNHQQQITLTIVESNFTQIYSLSPSIENCQLNSQFYQQNSTIRIQSISDSCEFSSINFQLNVLISNQFSDDQKLIFTLSFFDSSLVQDFSERITLNTSSPDDSQIFYNTSSLFREGKYPLSPGSLFEFEVQCSTQFDRMRIDLRIEDIVFVIEVRIFIYQILSIKLITSYGWLNASQITQEISSNVYKFKINQIITDLNFYVLSVPTENEVQNFKQIQIMTYLQGSGPLFQNSVNIESQIQNIDKFQTKITQQPSSTSIYGNLEIYINKIELQNATSPRLIFFDCLEFQSQVDTLCFVSIDGQQYNKSSCQTFEGYLIWNDTNTFQQNYYLLFQNVRRKKSQNLFIYFGNNTHDSNFSYFSIAVFSNNLIQSNTTVDFNQELLYINLGKSWLSLKTSSYLFTDTVNQITFTYGLNILDDGKTNLKMSSMVDSCSHCLYDMDQNEFIRQSHQLSNKGINLDSSLLDNDLNIIYKCYLEASCSSAIAYNNMLQIKISYAVGNISQQVEDLVFNEDTSNFVIFRGYYNRILTVKLPSLKFTDKIPYFIFNYGQEDQLEFKFKEQTEDYMIFYVGAKWFVNSTDQNASYSLLIEDIYFTAPINFLITQKQCEPKILSNQIQAPLWTLSDPLIVDFSSCIPIQSVKAQFQGQIFDLNKTLSLNVITSDNQRYLLQRKQIFFTHELILRAEDIEKTYQFSFFFRVNDSSGQLDNSKEELDKEIKLKVILNSSYYLLNQSVQIIVTKIDKKKSIIAPFSGGAKVIFEPNQNNFSQIIVKIESFDSDNTFYYIAMDSNPDFDQIRSYFSHLISITNEKTSYTEKVNQKNLNNIFSEKLYCRQGLITNSTIDSLKTNRTYKIYHQIFKQGIQNQSTINQFGLIQFTQVFIQPLSLQLKALKIEIQGYIDSQTVLCELMKSFQLYSFQILDQNHQTCYIQTAKRRRILLIRSYKTHHIIIQPSGNDYSSNDKAQLWNQKIESINSNWVKLQLLNYRINSDVQKFFVQGLEDVGVYRFLNLYTQDYISKLVNGTLLFTVSSQCIIYIAISQFQPQLVDYSLFSQNTLSITKTTMMMQPNDLGTLNWTIETDQSYYLSYLITDLDFSTSARIIQRRTEIIIQSQQYSVSFRLTIILACVLGIVGVGIIIVVIKIVAFYREQKAKQTIKPQVEDEQQVSDDNKIIFSSPISKGKGTPQNILYEEVIDL